MGPNLIRLTYYIWRGWQPLLFMFILSCDIGMFRLCFLSMFSRVAMLFSTRVFLIRIHTSSLGKERFFELHFLIPAFYPSYLLQLQRIFCLEMGCVAGCSKGGSHWAISGLVFQWRGSQSMGGSTRRDPGNIFTYLASGRPSTIPHSTITFLNCVIFGGNCWEGSLSSSRGSISE